MTICGTTRAWDKQKQSPRGTPPVAASETSSNLYFYIIIFKLTFFQIMYSLIT